MGVFSCMQTVEERPLLPNEPRQLNWQKEGQLTQQFLMPVLVELETFFLQLRAELDPMLIAVQPIKAGKPYPLGQCLEISLAMKSKLQEIKASDLQGAGLIAFTAIQQFVKHGGAIRQIWGDLRGEYFQNAFMFGDLYVDVSNDTVVPTKPKVEILPFSRANLSAIRDFQHFSYLVKRYWKAQTFPNVLFPALAPYAPILIRYADGSVQLHDASDYMVMLTCRDGFHPSASYLSSADIDHALFRQLSDYCQKRGWATPLAANPEQGLLSALEHCRQYRAEGRHAMMAHTVGVVQQIVTMNTQLSDFVAVDEESLVTL